MQMPGLPLFLNDPSPLQQHIDQMRSVRWGCMLAEIEERVVLRTRLSEAQNHRCCWCHVRFSDVLGADDAPSLEHVIPIALGGTNTPDNLAVACRRCNTKRGTQDVDTFLAFVQSLGWHHQPR